MVDIGNAVYLILKADAALTALVGTRIYAGPLPDTTIYPAIVRWITEREEIETLDEVPSVSNLVRTQFRLISVAKSATKEKAQEIAFDVFDAMNDRLRHFGKGYVSSISSPTEKVWIAGVSAARDFSEFFNQTTFAWETSATYDFWSRPTY